MTSEEDNQRLREQVAQRDQRIQQQEPLLCQQSLLMQQMQAQIAALTQHVKDLQDRLAKDSHNSSLPPSSDRFVRQPKSLRTKSEKQTGGQEGHPGTTLRFSQAPDEVIEHLVSVCASCQHDLREVEACVTLRRQVVDVPSPRLIVQEHRAEQKQCPRCQHLTLASFPTAVAAPIEQQIKEALIEAAVLHQDETGVSVAGKRYWEHVTSTATLTHYHVDSRRGQDALNAIGILPVFTGISIHDAWGSYFLYACEHALCLVHLLRELVFQAEEQGAVWAADLKDLLLSMKQATQQAREQGKRWLDPLEVLDWETAFLRLLDEGDRVTPRATAPPGTKGRIKQSAARTLLDRLRKHQKAVFCFLEDLRVDFDNNLAERDLRMMKVQQKVSGCFRSLAGAQAFSRIRGYVSTLRKQGLPLLPALQATLRGHPLLPSFE